MGCLDVGMIYLATVISLCWSGNFHVFCSLTLAILS